MNKIGLDLAYRTVGISIMTEDKLFYTSFDLSKERLPAALIIYHMVDKVWGVIEPYLTSAHVLVLEDIYKGKWENLKNIARTQGAVIDRYVSKTGKIPELINAVTARDYLGLPGIAPKVAIQLWALDTFKLKEASKIDATYRSKIEDTISQYYRARRSKQKGDRKRRSVPLLR